MMLCRTAADHRSSEYSGEHGCGGEQDTHWQQQQQAVRPLRIEGTQAAGSKSKERSGADDRAAKKVLALCSASDSCGQAAGTAATAEPRRAHGTAGEKETPQAIEDRLQ
ncbi:TPA: hypothetical protein ACH3X2_013475 [Trebouxia sp. C0005]